MRRDKRIAAWLCAVLLLAAVMGFGNPAALATSAEAQNNGADGSANDSWPSLEDFAGEYTCTTIMFGSNVMPLQEEPYTLSINGDEAAIVGFEELGSDPLKLQFEDGEMYFAPPEEDERVYTLRLQDDGVVTLTFDRIPEAPIFRFDPVESK